MNHSNTIKVSVGNSDFITAPGVYQYDYGITLHVNDLTTGTVKYGHFAVETSAYAMNLRTTSASGGIDIQIPDPLLVIGKDIYVYLFAETSNYGYTARTIKIPVVPRTEPDTISLSNPYYADSHALAEQLQSLISSATSADSTLRSAASTSTIYMNRAKTAMARAEELADGLLPMTNSEIDAATPWT